MVERKGEAMTSDVRMAPAETDDIAALEYELATLARTLEALNRHRNYPLERAHYLLLMQLKSGPLSIGELATRLMLDNSTVTRQVNAMLKKQLIEKTPNPDDGRSALVRRTAAGGRLVESMHRQRVSRLGETLQEWRQADRKKLTALTARLTRDLIASMQD